MLALNRVRSNEATPKAQRGNEGAEICWGMSWTGLSGAVAHVDTPNT